MGDIKQILIAMLGLTFSHPLAVFCQHPVQAYVANRAGESASVINTNTHQLIGTVALPAQSFPDAIKASPDGRFVYVADFNGDFVDVIETSLNQVVHEIQVQTSPASLSFTPNGLYCYVANSGSDSVSVIKTTTLTVVATISVGPNPGGIAISPLGTVAYVTSTSNNSVTIISLPENSVSAVFPVGNYPNQVAFSPDGACAYISNSLDDTISVVDVAAGGETVATIPVGSFPWGIAVKKDGTRVYIANNDGDTITVIDVLTSSVIDTIVLSSCATPFGIEVTPDDRELYVPESLYDRVSVFSTSSNAFVTYISVGESPVAVTFAVNQPSPPKDFKGKQVKEQFLFQTDRINVLTWKPSLSPDTSYYLLLRDNVEIARMSSKGPYRYEDHDRKKGVSTVYTLYAVEKGGIRSDPVVVVISD